MAKRTTVVLSDEEVRLLREASKKEKVTQSALIRRGIHTVTSQYRRRARPLTGWLKLTPKQWRAIDNDEFGDRDA